MARMSRCWNKWKFDSAMIMACQNKYCSNIALVNILTISELLIMSAQNK